MLPVPLGKLQGSALATAPPTSGLGSDKSVVIGVISLAVDPAINSGVGGKATD
jgi:hypothetical protein